MFNANPLVRLFVLGAVAAAFGCGGSSDRITPAGGAVNFAGGAATLSQPTETKTVPGQGGTFVATAQGNVIVPSGVTDPTVTPNTFLAVLPAGFGFRGAFTPGADLVVNGVTNSGARVGIDGLLDHPVGLPVTEAGVPYTLSFPDGTLDTRALTVANFVFEGTFYLRTNQVISPVPISLTGSIPNNGENAVGAHISATFSAGNNGRSATLTIDYGTGFVLQQTKTIANNAVSFSDLSMDTQNVPNTGVQTIKLAIGNL
jgi:hypothetical protein